MKFGPADFMDGLKALILVMTASAAITGIILGAIVALYRNFFRDRAAHHFQHREADLSFQAGMSTALPTVPAQKIDATGPSPRSPVPRVRGLALIGIIIAIATAGAGFLSYYTSMRSSFVATYNNQPRNQPSPPTVESQTESTILKQLGIRPLFPTVEPQQQVRESTSNQPGIQPSPPIVEPQQQVRSDLEETYKQLGIQPLPFTVERQGQIQRRLAQLSREACYTDAIVGLGRALLDAGYPREAAVSSRSFVKRCGSAPEACP
jgi:hypothetical protein